MEKPLLTTDVRPARQVALECDSMLPLGVARPRPNGWISLKSRIARKALGPKRKTPSLHPESLNFFESLPP